METRTRVISEIVVRLYETAGLISPVFQNMHKVSISMISPSSSKKSSTESSSQFIPTNSVRAASINKETHTVDIPAILESYETYIFLGFTEERAKDMWNCHLTQPSDMCADFSDWLCHAIEDDMIPVLNQVRIAGLSVCRP